MNLAAPRVTTLPFASVGESLWWVFVEPLVPIGHQKALIGGCLVAVVCGVIGCFIILRRMAFLGDALSHSMLAGVTAGYLFLRLILKTDDLEGPELLLGSLIAGVVTVAMVAFVSKLSRIKEDAAIGMMYTGIFAVGAVLASIFRDVIHIDLYHFVTGQTLGVSDSDLWTMAVIAAFVLSVVILFFRQLQLVSFDPVMAASIGIPVLAMDYLLTTCTSFVVIGAVGIVGVILVVGLLVTPAATAYLLCDRLPTMMGLAALFGVTSVVGGIYLMSWTGNFPPGAAVVIVSTGQFLVVMMIAPRYGLVADWLRRWRMVPQTIVEDVIGGLRREQGRPATAATIARHVEAPPGQIQKAIRHLLRRDWIEEDDHDRYLLTKTGLREARRLTRAHRLWESYLAHVGVASEALHARAHELEHLHDEATVDYLDDKLGHPLRDPHGSEIPEDFVHLVPGEEVDVSMMREGHQGVITEVGAAAADLGLSPQTTLTAGPREEDSQLWSVRLDDGRELKLDHPMADAIYVRLIAPTMKGEPNTD